MRNKTLVVLFMLTAVLFFIGGFFTGRSAVLQSNNDPIYVKVVRVIDGDTVEIEGGERVRYLGVGSPESVDSQKPVQCFGQEAKQKNKELVEGKVVRLERGIKERDRFCRILAYVWVENNMVNIELIKQGYARKYLLPRDSPYKQKFIDAELEAESEKKGIWRFCPKEEEKVRQNKKKADHLLPMTMVASWYGSRFHGKKTTSGERFDMYKFTAAHKTLPLGTRLRVMHPDTGKHIVVKINDRGPFIHGRDIDLSYQAAKKIGMVYQGTAHVRVKLITN